MGNRDDRNGIPCDGVLLGSIPLEDMDLVVNSRPEKVTVNPASPNIPSTVVKKAARPAG